MQEKSSQYSTYSQQLDGVISTIACILSIPQERATFRKFLRKWKEHR